MTAEEVRDDTLHLWECQTCDAHRPRCWHQSHDDVKRAATKHCNDTGHTVHVMSEHRHTMEIREVPT